MAKTITKKPIKPLGQRPGRKQANVSYPVEQEDLDQQQERLRKAAAAGAAASSTPTPVEQTSAPATVPSKPLTPLAALWPDPVSSKGGAKPSQAPAPQAQTAPATAPKPAGAKAAPSSQPPVQPVPPNSPDMAAVAAPAVKPAAPKTFSVSFALHKPNAKRVSLCGEFNGWSPGATPMKQHDDGHWETTVPLAPGRYQYKFIVDDEWIADPAAQKNVPNEHGSFNSVVEVRT